MRKVLMIAYHFPPLTTSGTYRSLQFARYLPGHGWGAVVLTVRAETLRAPGILDREPLAALPADTRVVRTRAIEPLDLVLRARDRLRGRPSKGNAGVPTNGGGEERTGGWRDWVSDLLTVPDRQVGWIPSALSAALRIIDEEDVSAIYSSSPPASGHVAALLAARLTGCPWIVDFRDPWTSSRFAPDRSLSLVRPLDRFLEAAVLSNAARVVATTDEMRADFAARFPECAGKLVTITNGYDPEEALPPLDRPAVDRPFTITHAGTLYGPRDPSPLLRAVGALLERGAISPDRLRVLFVGSTSGGMPWRGLLESPLLASVVRFEPKVSRGEALRRLAASDLLLVVQAGTDLQVPRKLYEYMALGKPILALVTGGATETVVREERAGRIVRPDDPEGIETALLEALRGEGLSRPERPERFDFRRLSGALAEVLEEAVP